MKPMRLILFQIVLTASCLADVVPEGVLIDRVWSGHPVGFDILTDRGHQFIAYFDAERRLTVKGRSLGETKWTSVHPEGAEVARRKRMSNVTGWDSHNYLTMALDRDGCLHLSGNMHTDPLVYYRTSRPFDLTTLERIDHMTGDREQSATYPRFFTNDTGDLVFGYRDGGSGNGSDLYNIYDPKTHAWRRLFDGPLLDGEGQRSAYSMGPQRGPDGRFHLLWMWRDTPDAMTNHTLSYACSKDLIHWETSTGKPLARPITMAKAEVIDPAKPGEGLINVVQTLGFDHEKRPVALYHRFDSKGMSQAFVARPDSNGQWTPKQISHWNFRMDFSGGGSQSHHPRMMEVCQPLSRPSWRVRAAGVLMVNRWQCSKPFRRRSPPYLGISKSQSAPSPASPSARGPLSPAEIVGSCDGRRSGPTVTWNTLSPRRHRNCVSISFLPVRRCRIHLPRVTAKTHPNRS